MSKPRTEPERKPALTQPGGGGGTLCWRACACVCACVFRCACQILRGLGVCLWENILLCFFSCFFFFLFFVFFFTHFHLYYSLRWQPELQAESRAPPAWLAKPNRFQWNSPITEWNSLCFSHRGSRLPRKKKGPSFYDFWFPFQKIWECNATFFLGGGFVLFLPTSPPLSETLNFIFLPKTHHVSDCSATASHVKLPQSLSVTPESSKV